MSYNRHTGAIHDLVSDVGDHPRAHELFFTLALIHHGVQRVLHILHVPLHVPIHHVSGGEVQATYYKRFVLTVLAQ